MLHRWIVPANKKLDDIARKEYDKVGSVPAQWHASVKPKANEKKTKGKKNTKRKPDFVPLPAGRSAFFLIDCETTGSKRNWDRGIEYCVIAYDKSGKLLDRFCSRVSNEGVRVKPSAYAVHGISYRDLKDAPSFSIVGRRMNEFFERVLQNFDAGVLVAHNGSTDFQFLSCDYIRAGLTLPTKITHTLCTLQSIRRFSGLAYRKAPADQWTVLTAKGNPSMSVNACATFVLAKRTPAGSFEKDCGKHHEAEADVKGVAVILFDKRELGKMGLWSKIFVEKKNVCTLLQCTWDDMQKKMQSPVIKLEPLPKDWIGNPVNDLTCESTCDTLPDGVEPTHEPPFRPRHQRGEGQPSTVLHDHLRQSGHHKRHKWQGTARQLMFTLFLFFFPITLLSKIAFWTTLKATEYVVKTSTVIAGKTKKRVHRLDYRSSSCKDWMKTKPRLSKWKRKHKLTAGELLVWIGIRIRMGVLNKKRVCHYWSKMPGVGDPIIANAMKQDRFNCITSALSFARPNASSGWSKFEYVDRTVRAACRIAVGLTQHFAIDESMIRCFSRYCRWKQFMPRKPIKTGIKVFALVLSIGFLYDWHVFRGSSDPTAGKNAMYTLIHDILVTSGFDNIGCVMFCDAAFTSISLFRKLFKRGIYAVGPINAKKPDKGADGNSWPHQQFKSGDTEYLARGWDRTAFSPIDGGGWIQATVWRDNKFVKLLNTVYIVDGVESVTRWVKSAADYLTVNARLVVKKYQHHMGHVDRVDKNVALSCIRLQRCKNRYHRHMFLWLLAAVGFNNVLVLFMLIFPAAEELKKEWEHNGFGFKHWWQNELGLTLIERGVQMCNVRRRNKAAAVLHHLWRSGEWTCVWRRYKRRSSVPSPAPTGCPIATVTPTVRKRGRPSKKTKRRSGGGQNKLSTPSASRPPTAKARKARQRRQDRLNSFQFQSPPPFMPKKSGRKRKSPDGNCVFVKGSRHCLVHCSTLNKWKTVQGFCVCCYSRAPPVKNSRYRSKKFMSDGTRIPSSNFACDVCEVRLCDDCFYNEYPPPHQLRYETTFYHIY